MTVMSTSAFPMNYAAVTWSIPDNADEIQVLPDWTSPGIKQRLSRSVTADRSLRARLYLLLLPG